MNISIRSTLYTGAAGALALALCTANVASADEPNPPTKTVNYADLDIEQPAGVKVLYRRIQAAAKQVCPRQMDSVDMIAAQQACINKAIDDAVKSVNVVALTELRFGSPLRLASK
jgi:UrcA family protein